MPDYTWGSAGSYYACDSNKSTAGVWSWDTGSTTATVTYTIYRTPAPTVWRYAEPVEFPAAVSQEEDAEKVAAVQAAEELLKEVVGEEAYAQAQELDYYEVPSATIEGRVYRVSKQPGSSRFIKVFEHGVEVDTLCVHPDLAYPTADIVLAQMVNLLWDEEGLLAVANRHGAGAARW